MTGKKVRAGLRDGVTEAGTIEVENMTKRKKRLKFPSVSVETFFVSLLIGTLSQNLMLTNPIGAGILLVLVALALTVYESKLQGWHDSPLEKTLSEHPRDKFLVED